MIYIEVQLWPQGDEKRATVIARGLIANDGTGTTDTGNYDAAFAYADGRQRNSKVRGFPRSRAGFWWLLFLALKNLYKAS